VTGTVDAGSTVAVTLDTAASAGPVSINGSSWSVQLSGLVKGANHISVTASNQAGASATVSATIVVSGAPNLILNPVLTPTNSAVQTISGTVDAGVTPVVLLASSAQAAPVTVSGTTWSCAISGLVPGANALTVLAVDAVGNLSFQKATLVFDPSDGDVNMDGRVDVADALIALRIAVGVAQPTADQRLHADVAPLQNGIPAPDNSIDIADALQILRKAVALVNF
jgi:membrane protein implicated in regulation of membrane protease activity